MDPRTPAGEPSARGTGRRVDIGPELSPYLTGAVVDGAVALVTSAAGTRTNVMTASFFAESSHVPVLARVAISPATLTHELVSEAGWFGLSVLGRGQEDLAIACGTRSGRDGCKFRRLGIETRRGDAPAPLLPGCLTTSACRVVERVETGDHTLFVGEIVSSFRQTRVAHRLPLLVSDLLGWRV